MRDIVFPCKTKTNSTHFASKSTFTGLGTKIQLQFFVAAMLNGVLFKTLKYVQVVLIQLSISDAWIFKNIS